MKIFISSTISDLESERISVAQAIQGLRMEAYLSEADGANWSSSYEKCFREVEDSDIYLLIIGNCYGFKPAKHGEWYDGKTSVTHAEFKLAERLNKPMLIYAKNTTRRETEATDFLEHLQDFFSGYFRKNFSQSEELTSYVQNDILTLLTEIIRGTYRYPKLLKPTIVLCDNRNDLFRVGSQMICFVLDTEPLPVFGFMPGRTAGGIYGALISNLSRENRISAIPRMTSFHVVEHFGVTGRSPCSYQNWMNRSLYNRIEDAHSIKVDRSKIHFIRGIVSVGSIKTECERYDTLVSSSTIHLQLLGLAPNGQSMSVDPDIYDRAELINQQTSLVKISQDTFEYLLPQPPILFCITIGMGNILRFTRKVALFAFGADKAEAVRTMLTTTNYREAPCIALRSHSDFWVVVDRDAASRLPTGWEAFYEPIPSSDLLSGH